MQTPRLMAVLAHPDDESLATAVFSSERVGSEYDRSWKQPKLMTDNEDRRYREEKGAELSVQAGRLLRARHRVSELFEMFPPFLNGGL